jgi:hypothetical protein
LQLLDPGGDGDVVGVCAGARVEARLAHGDAAIGRDDDTGRYAADDCEDEDDEACGAALQQQNATPPSNGLFTPGSKPRVQTN